ncbi:CDP-diacylglycerol--serine O-phosphatidyltransferase [Mycena sanguinolenta]|uniref:CDP-diacylglycerol--serine O-phosphatidyltransferase n=1 Tax=Mycena sanguinolenta TaxID=230812 RepID=A0A8H6YNT0_9AGAR|nr:CDP-diacylglycerol--serine O-phosphatidyltransferase [Mycena sanguinolenta]
MSTRKRSPNDESARKAEALQQYQDSDGHFTLVRSTNVPSIASVLANTLFPANRNFRLADLVTIMNGVCGSLSIFSSAHYLVNNDIDYLWSALALPLAGLMFDFFDGKVARWRNSSSMLGQELDSLADLVSFGVAPALLAFVVGLRTYLDTVFLTAFICCGLARLARFNATVALIPKDGAGKAKYFEGLPIPSSLALVAVLAYWTKQGWIEGQQGVPWGTWTLWGSAGGRGEIHVVSILFGGWAAAMVSKTLRVPKI